MPIQIYIPKNCPSCGHSLVLSKTEVDLLCPNSGDCPAQIVGRLAYFTQRNLASITGLSERHIARFAKDLQVRDLPDLFDLDWETIRSWDGFGDKSVENLQKSVEKTRQGIADYKFLAGLGIEGIGPEVAKLICEKLQEI